MALVKVIGNNLFTGANLHKLEVGSKVEVDRSTLTVGRMRDWLKSSLMTIRCLKWVGEYAAGVNYVFSIFSHFLLRHFA